MNFKNESPSKNDASAGLVFGSLAFLIWGFSPLYWKLLAQIGAFEIILHRVVWSFVFLLPLIAWPSRRRAFWAVLTTPRHLAVFTVTALLVAANWLLYIWAINHERVLQASLGYYINPLVNVLLGTLFLKEKLRPAQAIACGLAACGVLYLTVVYGEFPWVALALAFSFGLYGLIRKVVPVGSLVGLSVETLILTIPAAVGLVWLAAGSGGAFLNVSLKIDLLLIGTAFVTALPLWLFALGARRLNLTTIGFLQYMAPTCMFFLGLFFFKEPFASAQMITFAMILSALGLYLFDSVAAYRQREHL